MIWAIIDRKRLLRWLEAFIGFLEDYPYLAPFMIIILYIFAAIFFLPGSILTLGSGFALNQAYGNAWCKTLNH